MIQSWLIRISLLTAVALLFGCAGSSMFTKYPSRLEPVRASIEKGNTEKPEESLEDILDSSNVADRVLFLQEHGRVSQISENSPDESIRSYGEAIEIVKQRDQEALVKTSDVASTLASIATSDNAIPYEPPPHERAFLRTFQAMNYLQQGKVESARVEVMNLEHEQKTIRERQEREIDELEASLTAKGKDGATPTQSEIAKAQQKRQAANAVVSNPAFASVAGVMVSEVADVRSSNENAYSYYVSGLIYELNEGDVDDDNALTSYTKALEIAPNNPYVADGAYQLQDKICKGDSECGRKPALGRHWRAHGQPKLQAIPAGSGRIVILHEQGFVMPRSQIKFPVPVAGTVNNIALPYYRKDKSRPQPVKVFVDGTEKGSTAPLTDVRKLAVKHLVDDYPKIAIRQALRLAAKAAAQAALKEAGGSLASTAFGLVDLVVTNADMRTWLTLPANIQVASFYVPAGKHEVELHEADGHVVKLAVNVKAGGIAVVRSIELIGPATYTDHMASN